MVYRIVNLPMDKKYFNKEVDLNKQIAENSGYKTTIIDGILTQTNSSECIPKNRRE